MGKLLPKTIDSIRAKISLAKLISRDLNWDPRKSQSSKGDYWACCPFHEESTASFHVDDRKGFYYCFGCHVKGDAITYLKDRHGMSFNEAVKFLAEEAGLSDPFSDVSRDIVPIFATIIEMKEFIVENFIEENIIEIGIITNSDAFIQSHPRLLRSLHWGDPDYPGCVLELLRMIERKGEHELEKVKDYIARRFPEESSSQVMNPEVNKALLSLGLDIERPRSDQISVMMPFGHEFSSVYSSIRSACEKACDLKVVRADEVWNNSVLIKDILDMIWHSAIVICDLSSRNPNVFYELGIAHA